MGALLHLDVSNNSIGELVYVDPGWTKGLNAARSAHEYAHTDGRVQAEEPAKEAKGAIAVANAIKDMGALSILNLASNRLGAEAFKVSTELYVEEKLVTTSVAAWASTLRQSLPSDRLEVVSASPPLADGDITNMAEVLGKAVMVIRGGCSFVAKAQRLQAAGAVAMFCVNNDELRPDKVFEMAGDGAGKSITIPVVLVSFNTGLQIRAMFLRGVAMAVTIKKSLSLTDTLKNHK
jgi:hypothetical protein